METRPMCVKVKDQLCEGTDCPLFPLLSSSLELTTEIKAQYVALAYDLTSIRNLRRPKIRRLEENLRQKGLLIVHRAKLCKKP